MVGGGVGGKFINSFNANYTSEGKVHGGRNTLNKNP